MFCKTKAVECLPKFNHKGKEYQGCTSDSIGESDEKEKILWCATEVDENNEMVHWGQCDFSTCKYDISCLFTNVNNYQSVQTVTFIIVTFPFFFEWGFAKVTFINDKMSDFVEL